ncbi:sulfotransferase family 2 domain-containing protein [Aureimonas sp. SA4125]|uniref:sulfotransferase family 2 domain-containing protein n=1 Tax=Aureimonas sp. SA4125 TaxID=2826993 RepID=UPI001CC7E37C|nr:sulfotransferase family 2 domain-containing protein [Aureimonas sp. SA4125]
MAELKAERDRYEAEAALWRMRVNSEMRVPPPLQSRQVAFLHIMKCGGTSIQRALTSMMPGVPLRNLDETKYDAMTSENLANYGLLMGHFSYDHVRKFRRPFLLTFLREPMDRVVSMYEFLRALPDLPGNSAPVELAHRLSLADWVASEEPDCIRFSRDTQAYSLASDWRAPRVMPVRELADLALSHLDGFDFVGFLDTIQADTARLAAIFGAAAPVLAHEKKAASRPGVAELDAKTRELIERYNQADMIVYQEALRQFGGGRGTMPSTTLPPAVRSPSPLPDAVIAAENLARHAEVAEVRADLQRRVTEYERVVAAVVSENNLVKAELGRLQRQIQAELESAGSISGTKAELHQRATDAEAVVESIRTENHALRAELGRLQAQIAVGMASDGPPPSSEPVIDQRAEQAEEMATALRGENAALNAELRQLRERQIHVGGMPVQTLANRYRSLSGVPASQRSRQIAFLHIGKSAGTSVHHLLKSAMPEVPFFNGMPHDFDATPREAFEDYGLILGHFCAVHLEKLRKPLFLMTFLRDPIDRVLSSYYYLREAAAVDDPNSATMMAKSLSLSDFLQCDMPSVSMFTIDHQCHALGSDYRAPRDPDRRVIVDAALRHLATFDFIGFVETFDRDIARLGRVLDFTFEGQEMHRNRTMDRLDRSVIEPDVIKRIEQLNAGDIELYNAAQKMAAAHTP